MKKEIIDWYSERHFHPHKVIKVGRKHGRTEEQVLAAMEHCYHKIQDGKNIPAIDIARYIFNVAKDVDCSEYEKRIKAYKISEKTIMDLEEGIVESKAVADFRVKEVEEKLKDSKVFADQRVKEVENTFRVYMAYVGLLNMLAWLFFLNWR